MGLLDGIEKSLVRRLMKSSGKQPFIIVQFWPTIDPTVKDQQFCDVGSQYRTGIYPINDAQLKAAQESKAALAKVKPFIAPVVTAIVLAGTFYRPRNITRTIT